MKTANSELEKLFALMFQAHPWHGITAGDHAPEFVNVYVEIVPHDVVKYELDKNSGKLKVDRPQRFSSLCPLPYGFVPQTFCGDLIAQFCMQQTGKINAVGDGDPLDICVLTESAMTHGNFLLKAKPIGGLRMIDKNEADDKIIAVLYDDVTYGGLNDIGEVPTGQIERLRHYFLSYKQLPTEASRTVEITHVYGRDEAHEIIRRSQQDYRAEYGAPESRFDELRRLLQSKQS